ASRRTRGDQGDTACARGGGPSAPSTACPLALASSLLGGDDVPEEPCNRRPDRHLTAFPARDGVTGDAERHGELDLGPAEEAPHRRSRHRAWQGDRHGCGRHTSDYTERWVVYEALEVAPPRADVLVADRDARQEAALAQEHDATGGYAEDLPRSLARLAGTG